MKIGIDLDDTLVQNNIILNVLKKYKIDYNHINFTNGIENTGLPTKVINEIFNNFLSPLMGKLKPTKHAIHIIEELVRYNHDIYIITARPLKLKKITEKLVKSLFPGIKLENIIYVGKSDKSNIIKKLKISVMVDDNISYINKLNLNKTFMFILYNESTIANKEMIDSFYGLPNVQIIHDLNELLFKT